MALITMRDVCWGFDTPPLLENISLTLKKGERVCLLGRNGVGKSTLLKLISGQMVADRGHIQRQSGIWSGWKGLCWTRFTRARPISGC